VGAALNARRRELLIPSPINSVFARTVSRGRLCAIGASEQSPHVTPETSPLKDRDVFQLIPYGGGEL